jgi:hypothetical protein
MSSQRKAPCEKIVVILQPIDPKGVSMTTITQFKERLQYLLGPRADELARETGAVQRRRELDGSDLVQALIFSFLQQPDATGVELLQGLQRRKVQISEGALSQRFTPACVQVFERLFQELVQEPMQAEVAVPAELLCRFDAIILEDSTSIRLPPKLKEQWPGCGGGQGQSGAGLKVHVRFDLKRGGLHGVQVSPGRQGDQSSALRQEGIKAGVLNITDESYCSLTWLKEQEGFFLTRPRATVCFLDSVSKQELDLSQIGPKVSNGSWQGEVLVGKEAQLPARLVLVRVPEEVITQRRKHLREEAKRRGKAQVNEQALFRAQWTILITNVGADQLSLSEVIVLQRGRWQIERLFRLWKQDGKIDEWRGRKAERILCEIYAKLMAMVIQQGVLVLGCWQDPSRSLVKAARVVRQAGLELLSALAGEGDWERICLRMFQAMVCCRVHRRGKHPSHAQLVLNGLDWSLT